MGVTMKIDNLRNLQFLFFLKAQLQIEIQPVVFKITSWRPMGKKKLRKHHDVWVKKCYFWKNQRQPTSCPLQNLIHVYLVEENCIFRAFQTKIHQGLIRSRNWVCLVLPESFGKIRFASAQKKILFLKAAQIANDQNLVLRNFRG
jgi:hypothetical protein